jgi:hypothetical protein
MLGRVLCRSWLSVIKDSNGASGKPFPQMDMFFLQGDSNQRQSFWCDVPINLKEDTVTCCIEVPK